MTLDDKVPRWTLSESRIGDNPGLGFRPMPKNISQGSLIWLDMKNASKAETFIHALDAFLLRKYRITNLVENCDDFEFHANFTPPQHMKEQTITHHRIRLIVISTYVRRAIKYAALT